MSDEGKGPKPVDEGTRPEPVRRPEPADARPERNDAGDGPDEEQDGGKKEGAKPISARAAMGAAAPETEARSGAPPAPTHRFRHRDEEWLARVAGEGAYGTGERGTAYVVAVHFFHVDHDETPVREALVPFARFDRLDESELQDLFERATPIERDDD